MHKIKWSTNVTVFVLFFGVAMLEAFQNRDWIQAVFG